MGGCIRASAAFVFFFLLYGVAAATLVFHSHDVHNHDREAGFKDGVAAMSGLSLSTEMCGVENVALRRSHNTVNSSSQGCSKMIQVPGSAKPMPAVGYIACCHYANMNGPTLVKGATNYLKHGGRLFDTAQLYGNEHIIGTVVKNSGIPREEIWVATKLNVVMLPKSWTREWVALSVDQSLRSFDVDYIDVMYLHFGPKAAARMFIQITRDQHVDLWKGLIDAKRAGKVRNIGVCMHTKSEIENLKLATGEAPAVAALWYSPFMPPATNHYVSWLQREGIAVSIYGALNFGYGIGGEPSSTQLKSVSQHPGMSWAQVVIRWALDQNVAIVTDMHDPQYVRENLDCSGLLTASDLQMLSAANKWNCHTVEQVQMLMGCVP